MSKPCGDIALLECTVGLGGSTELVCLRPKGHSGKHQAEWNEARERNPRRLLIEWAVLKKGTGR